MHYVHTAEKQAQAHNRKDREGGGERERDYTFDSFISSAKGIIKLSPKSKETRVVELLSPLKFALDPVS